MSAADNSVRTCHDCNGSRVDEVGDPCVFCGGTGEIDEGPDSGDELDPGRYDDDQDEP